MSDNGLAVMMGIQPNQVVTRQEGTYTFQGNVLTLSMNAGTFTGWYNEEKDSLNLSISGKMLSLVRFEPESEKAVSPSEEMLAFCGDWEASLPGWAMRISLHPDMSATVTSGTNVDDASSTTPGTWIAQDNVLILQISSEIMRLPYDPGTDTLLLSLGGRDIWLQRAG